MRGAIAVAAALILLQVALTTPLAGLAGAAAAPARWARAWMDPTVPLIPARAPAGPGGTQAGLRAAKPVNLSVPPAGGLTGRTTA